MWAVAKTQFEVSFQHSEFKHSMRQIYFKPYAIGKYQKNFVGVKF